MKICFVFVMVGLFLLTALPVGANEPTCVNTSNIELAYDDYKVGPVRNQSPLRDEGEDWITYDDGGTRGLITGGRGYWSKVTFTPNERFELQLIRFLPLNQYRNFDDEMQVRLYAEEGDHNLGEMLEEWVIEEVPEFDEWIRIELDEDNYFIFEADENFSILYDSPGGIYDQDVNREGDGWWNLYDGSPDAHRSFYDTEDFGGDPDEDHDNWRETGGDLLLRANGDYLVDFNDLEITEVYNDTELWMVLPGMEHNFVADVVNNGADLEVYVISFQVMDSEMEVVWRNDVMGRDLAEGDDISIETDEAWVAPEEVGLYSVWAFAQLEDDANEENNQGSMDQIVFDPTDHGDEWIGYVDGELEGSTGWNESSGWANAFYHPGGDNQALTLDAFRVAIHVDADAEVELDFSIMTLDLEANPPLSLIWEGTATTTGEGEDFEDGILEWVEVEPEYDEDHQEWGIFEGQAVMITYFYDEETRFPNDNSPPFAGTNAVMPMAALQTQDDGGGYSASGSGDYPIECKLSWSDIPVPGPHFKIKPDDMSDLLQFGWDLELNQEYEIALQFISYGDETVTIDTIQVGRSGVDNLTFSPGGNFDIEPGDTLDVIATFITDQEEDLTSSSMIMGNTGNIPWRFHASTLPPPGGIMVEPALVEFGFELAFDEAHSQTFTVSSVGDNDLLVSSVEIPEMYAELFSITPEGEVTISPEQTQEYTITFQTAEAVVIETEFTIHNNSDNAPEFELGIQASTNPNAVSEESRSGLPELSELFQNHPNPFNPVTTVGFALNRAGTVELSVFDMSGRVVINVYNGYLAEGYHNLEIDASNLPAGVYMYQLISEGFKGTRKMVLMK